MRAIDKKGRLFGLINIFDIFVLFMLILSIFFACKWIRMAEDPSWVNVKAYHTFCTAESVFLSYMADLVKEGDEMINEDGVVVAKVEKVLDNKPAPTTVYSSKDGEKLFFNSEARNITVILSLRSYEKRGEAYACVSGTPIKIGSGFLINTKNYSSVFSVRKILSTEE